MAAHRYRRIGLIVALLLGVGPAVYGVAAQQNEAKPEYFVGKVVPLNDVIAKTGGKLDADAAATWMALVMDDGRVIPLVKDDGSRMFFMDKALLNRPMRLQGRLVPNSQLLQVISVNSYLNGVLHDVFYWCDICTIRGSEPGECPCCHALYEYREPPLKEP